MITVQEAKEFIRNRVPCLAPHKVPLAGAAGQVLAYDVHAEADVPAFPQSAMDGFAFRFEEYEAGQCLPLAGIVPAGRGLALPLPPRRAVRIFTGAPVPEGADTVVIQEKASADDHALFIQDPAIRQGSNVRPKGSEIAAGTLALPAGTLLTPAAIGLLAMLGTAEVWTCPLPSVSLIITGSELQQPGFPLGPGQVYESNSAVLRAALQGLGILRLDLRWAEDDPEVIMGRLDQALQQSSLVLLTGGVSVGDYDYVRKAAFACGVQQLFHQVKQKPGKPLYFGMKGAVPVFGLPGNPASVLTCFYEYVVPALEELTGRREIICRQQLPLAAEVRKKAGCTQFLKGKTGSEGVMPLGAQESYRLSSFALADCLICLEEEKTDYRKGDPVEVHLLPRC